MLPTTLYRNLKNPLNMYVYIYIYKCTYVQRERERENGVYIYIYNHTCIPLYTEKKMVASPVWSETSHEIEMIHMIDENYYIVLKFTLELPYYQHSFTFSDSPFSQNVCTSEIFVVLKQLCTPDRIPAGMLPLPGCQSPPGWLHVWRGIPKKTFICHWEHPKAYFIHLCTQINLK